MNLCIDEIRKRKVRKILSLDFLTEDVLEKNKKSKEHLTPLDTIENEERKLVVQTALQKLTVEHREVLYLREYHDYSYNEIAESLRISIEAVKSRIFRARNELRKLLSSYFEEKT